MTDSATNVAFVAHIDLQNRLPGILGLLRFRPATAKPLMGLAELLLRGESPLSRGERELIAAEVSNLNGCQFCYNAHGTHAALQLDGGWDVVDAVVTDLDGAPLSDKLKALLRIAIAVAAGGKRVTPAMIEAAKTALASGASVIGIVGKEGALVDHCTVVLLVETLENTDVYTPTISRLAALTLIDILATSVVIRRGKEHNFRVAEMKRHLAAMRGSL